MTLRIVSGCSNRSTFKQLQHVYYGLPLFRAPRAKVCTPFLKHLAHCASWMFFIIRCNKKILESFIPLRNLLTSFGVWFLFGRTLSHFSSICVFYPISSISDRLMVTVGHVKHSYLFTKVLSLPFVSICSF